MLEIEKQNFSRQIVKQDKELSQFIKYLELQNTVAEKNQQKELKMKQKEEQLAGLREKQKETRDFQSKLKQLEISTIREKYDETLQLKNQSLQQRLQNQEMKHKQIISEATGQRQEQSMLRNLFLSDSVDKAIEKANKIQEQKIYEIRYKQEKKEGTLRQMQSEKSLQMQEKSVLFNMKQEINDLNYRRAQDILNSQIQSVQSKLAQKDSLSQQIQFENDRKLQSKLFQQKASLEHGLTNSTHAQERFLQNLNVKQSMTEYKMKKLDQLMSEKQMIQQNERARRALVEQKKHEMKEQFDKQMKYMQKLQKY